MLCTHYFGTFGFMSNGTHVSLIQSAELIREEQDFMWESGTSANAQRSVPLSTSR